MPVGAMSSVAIYPGGRDHVGGDEIPHYTFAVSTDPDSPGGRWIEVAAGDLPCQIAVRLGRPRPGLLCCTGLRVGPPDGGQEYEVTARMLRDIRLGNVLRAIREASWGATFAEHPQPSGLTSPLPLDGASMGEMMGNTARKLKVKRGRKGLDPETLRRTAETYLEVVREGTTQPLAVASERLDIHPSTVWRRLQNAWKRFPELKPKEDS